MKPENRLAEAIKQIQIVRAEIVNGDLGDDVVDLSEVNGEKDAGTDE